MTVDGRAGFARDPKRTFLPEPTLILPVILSREDGRRISRCLNVDRPARASVEPHERRHVRSAGPPASRHLELLLPKNLERCEVSSARRPSLSRHPEPRRRPKDLKMRGGRRTSARVHGSIREAPRSLALDCQRFGILRSFGRLRGFRMTGGGKRGRGDRPTLHPHFTPISHVPGTVTSV